MLGALVAAYSAGFWSGARMPNEPRPGPMPEPVPPVVTALPALADAPRGEPEGVVPPPTTPVPQARPPAPTAKVAPAALPLPQAPQRPAQGRLPPGITPPEHPAWRRFAAPAPAAAAGPMIAIVIDDVGPARQEATRAIALPAPVTLAFLPYASDIKPLVATARERGHEVLVHLPMEPMGRADPGPNALLSGLNQTEFLRRLNWNLEQFGGYVGVNNHMGSRLTSDPAAMEAVMNAVRTRGLLFLDSRTSPVSVAEATARRLGVPSLGRDVFLDNTIEAGAIRAQLSQAESRARQHGAAVAIGHPHSETLAVLNDWLPSARERGFTIVPLTAIVERRLKPSG